VSKAKSAERASHPQITKTGPLLNGTALGDIHLEGLFLADFFVEFPLGFHRLGHELDRLGDWQIGERFGGSLALCVGVRSWAATGRERAVVRQVFRVVRSAGAEYILPPI
jgi:hypothetical protein